MYDTSPTMIPLRRIDSEIIRFGRAAHQLESAIATYDAEFRAGFDRKITDWAIDFITRCKKQGTPFYAYLPYDPVEFADVDDDL